MNLLWCESFAQNVSFSLREDILVQRILLAHHPDARRLLDSELCLRAAEAIMRQTSSSQADTREPDCIGRWSIDVDASGEPLGHTIYRLSHEIVRCLHKDEDVKVDMCTKALALFDLLSNYTWDAKLSLVLSAFACIYGEFWVLNQLRGCNRLASTISLLKEMSFISLEKHKLLFKAISLLVGSMVALTRVVILFERLPIAEAQLDDGRISASKPLVYVAAYWIFRGVLICTSKLQDIRSSNDLSSELLLAGAVWELTSLEHRIRSISHELNFQVNACRGEVEQKMHTKFLNMMSETQDDNQKILRMLLYSRDDSPLKRSSEEKLGIAELTNKVVLLLISKPELLPIDEMLLLVQQIYDRPRREYEIVWIPIPSSENWSDKDVIIYDLLSNSLPWYSVRKPWSLSPASISLIKKEWKFKDGPMIVALDPGGNVRNVNAIDMGWIWGARAFPFSTSKEEELWGKEKWNLRLLVDSVRTWAEEEERVVCIYGSNNAGWTSDFIAKTKQIQQLRAVYVGGRGSDKKVRKILLSISKGELTSYLSWDRMQLFWIRLESMRRSRLKLGKSCDSDHILRQVEDLLSENDSGWMIVGQLSSTNTLKLRGQEAIRALSLFPVQTPRGLGHQPCNHSRIIKYEGATTHSLICDNCGRPMKKFIVFDTIYSQATPPLPVDKTDIICTAPITRKGL